MIELKKEVIKYAQKLNSTNLSPLRSGNVSVRATQDGVEGFLLTPSGKRYETLIPEDIVFLALKEKYDNLKLFNTGLNPSSEWRFHQDIYLKKIEAKAIVHAHSPNATAVSSHGKSIPAFHYMVALATNLKQAFDLAEVVENICHQYIIALKIGNPKILSWAEMNKILDKIKHYKKA